MVEIIPVILVKDFSEAFARIQAVKSCVDWMQIDVVDGEFAPNVSWGDPEALRSIDTFMRFEVDLMVMDSEGAVRRWLVAAPRVGRIYFHQETVAQDEERARRILRMIKGKGVEAGMSLNPETPIDALLPFISELDAVLFLGVKPGFSGGEFDEKVIEKVRGFHEKFPSLPITVDGGIKRGIARKLAEAGAARLAASTAIFDFDEVRPRDEIAVLRKDVEGY